MPSFYQYNMWNHDFQTHQELGSCDSSTPILHIEFQFQHFLQLNYPENTHVLLTSTNNSHQLPRHLLQCLESCQPIIQTVLSNYGFATEFIDAVAPEIASFACNLATTDRSTRVLAMVLNILVITPFNDHQVIDQALSEVEAMFQDGSSVNFKPAGESCIKGLKRFELDEEGLFLRKNNGSLVECVICWEDFLIGEEVVVLPCGHDFHGDCCVNWLKTSRFCPLCRFEML